MIAAFRQQLPAYSPLSPRAVLAGLRGTLGEPAGTRDRVAAALCDAYGARAALLVGSGTTALRLALAGARAMTSGKPAALPAYSCYDLATAAEGADVDVLLYDLDATTLGPDPASLRRALEREPGAVVAAHLYGFPVDMRLLARATRDAGAVLIEDAAQGAGGRLDGTLLGSFGSLTVLSFGRGKGTTAGAGGALLARDDIGAEIVAWAARRLPEPEAGVRDAIMLAAQWAIGRPRTYWLPASLPFLHLGETVYHRPTTPTAMTRAAVHTLAVTLGRSGAEVVYRQATAVRLRASAGRGHAARFIEPIDGAVPGYLRLPMMMGAAAKADALSTLAVHGVAPGYPTPLATLPTFRQRVVAGADAPGAAALANGLVTLPTHRLVGPADIDALEGWLRAHSE